MSETNRSETPDSEGLLEEVSRRISRINHFLSEINDQFRRLEPDLQNLILSGFMHEIDKITTGVRRLANISSRIDRPYTTVAQAREMIRWEETHCGKSHE